MSVAARENRTIIACRTGPELEADGRRRRRPGVGKRPGAAVTARRKYAASYRGNDL
jgi:hypothetical protein